MTDAGLGQSPGPLDDKSSAESLPDEICFGPKYVQRFADMMGHARELFVTDLSALQHELSTSRKLLIHLHETTSSQRIEIKSLSKSLATVKAEASQAADKVMETQKQLDTSIFNSKKQQEFIESLQ